MILTFPTDQLFQSSQRRHVLLKTTQVMITTTVGVQNTVAYTNFALDVFCCFFFIIIQLFTQDFKKYSFFKIFTVG